MAAEKSEELAKVGRIKSPICSCFHEEMSILLSSPRFVLMQNSSYFKAPKFEQQNAKKPQK